MKKIYATWQIKDANGNLLDKDDWYLRVVYSTHPVYKEGAEMYYKEMKNAAERDYEIIILP